MQVAAGKKKEAAATLTRLNYIYPLDEELHKKLGDLRRNPSVALASVLTDPTSDPFYVPNKTPPAFGSTFCAPIPPQETNANPNFSP